MIITIAWTEERQRVVKLGAVDLGQSHTFETYRSINGERVVIDVTLCDEDLLPAGRAWR
jgi:hypothetical protein